MTLQHLWRTTAVQTARTWRQTEKSQREASRRLSAFAEAEATAHGHLDSAEFSDKLGARVARVRRAWGELEGFYDDTAGERATLAAVIEGKANGVQIDAARVTLNPPLAVVHAAENTAGLSDCYDGGRLSFTGFFQLWAVALGVLKEKLDDRPADVGKKAEEVSTHYHRHKKHLSSALELLSRLSDSVLTDLDGSIKLLSRSVDDLQAKAGLSVKWASRSTRMAPTPATGRGEGRGGGGGGDAAAVGKGRLPMRSLVPPTPLVPVFGTPVATDSPLSGDTAAVDGGSLSVSARASFAVKSTDDFLRELVGGDAAWEAVVTRSSPSREVRVTPSDSLSSPYSPLRHQSVVSAAGASRVTVASKGGVSSWQADASGQSHGEVAATAATAEEAMQRPPPPLARGSAFGASTPPPTGRPPSTQSPMMPTRQHAVDMLTSRGAESVLAAHRSSSDAEAAPPAAVDATRAFSSRDLPRRAPLPLDLTAQPQLHTSGAWSWEDLDTSTMSARSTGSMAGSVARSPRVVGGLSFTPTPGGSQHRPAASLPPSAALLRSFTVAQPAGLPVITTTGKQPRTPSPAPSTASTTVVDHGEIDCGALNARVGSGAVVLTTLRLPSGFASPAKKGVCDMKSSIFCDMMTPTADAAAAAAAAAAKEGEIDALKRRLDQVKLRTPQGSPGVALARPTAAPFPSRMAVGMSPTQHHWQIAQGGAAPTPTSTSRLAYPASTPAPAPATPRGFDLSSIKARLDRQKEIYSPQPSVEETITFGNIDLDNFENVVDDGDGRARGLMAQKRLDGLREA